MAGPQRQLPPDRRAGSGVARDRSPLAVEWQREPVPERPRCARYDPVLPTRRPFALPGSKDHTWDLTLNNRFVLPRGLELQANYIRCGARNEPQGRERARSSLDLSAKKPLMNERAELVFTFTDICSDFALQHDITGNGFTALYQNFLETQVATLA